MKQQLFGVLAQIDEDSCVEFEAMDTVGNYMWGLAVGIGPWLAIAAAILGVLWAVVAKKKGSPLNYAFTAIILVVVLFAIPGIAEALGVAPGC